MPHKRAETCSVIEKSKMFLSSTVIYTILLSNLFQVNVEEFGRVKICELDKEA